MHFSIRTSLVSLALAGPCIAGAAPFAFTLNTNQTMYAVNVANNNEVLIGGTTFQSRSLAVDLSGTLYSADTNGVLWNVTGPPIPVGPTGFTAIGDLDYGVGGLWGFSNTTQSLFFFDFSSTSVTYSAAISGLGSHTIEGVAYRPSEGSIFLSGYTGGFVDRLFQVAPFATSASFIGQMTHTDAASYIADVDFDAAGNLHAMTWFHRHFYTVNTSTAATSLVSTGPHRDVVAMALTPVPEPATLIVLAGGLAACLRRRMRR